MLEKLKIKLSPDSKNEEAGGVKKKQTTILVIVLLVFFGVAFVGVLFSDNKVQRFDPNIKSKTVGTKLDTPGATVTGKDVWVSVAGQQISDLQKEKEDLVDRLKKLESSVSTIKEKAEQTSKASATPTLPALNLPLPPGIPGQVSSSDLSNGLLPNINIKNKSTGITTTDISSPETNKINDINSKDTSKKTIISNIGGNGKQVPQTVLNAASNTNDTKVVSTNDSNDNKNGTENTIDSIANKVNQVGELKKKVAIKRNYLPPGTFFKTVMLASLDAPTSGQTQANPHPVLLRIVDNAVLPNQFAGQIRECFIVGAGYGDLSSERAYIRTETLSCVSKKGSVIDVPINGWIIGEDGKAGMRGKLVSKQGQALASAMSSAVLAGIANMVSASAVTTTQTSVGITQSVPNSGAAFRAGVGEGVAKGVDRLTQFYISLAEKLFPVIEVDSGRTVDVALNKGLDLTGLFEGVYQSNLLETSEDLSMLTEKNKVSAPRISAIK